MRYAGGKGGAGVVQAIVNQIPPHDIYIEAFLGGGAVLRAKRPARCSIAIERDPMVASLWTGRELPELNVITGDAVAWLSRYRCTGKEFIYCDPPYLMATRTSQRPIYNCELSNRDHARLLAVLKRLDCCVAISGYWSECYARALKGWRTINFTSVKRNGVAAVEWLWMNYPEPVALHDYRFLGRNFRERERIGRRVKRWRRRIAAMPILERRAVLIAIAADQDLASPFPAIGAGEHRHKKRASRFATSGDADVLPGCLATNGDRAGRIAICSGAISPTSTTAKFGDDRLRTAISREGGHSGRARRLRR